MELPRYHLASYGAGAAGGVNPGGTRRRVPQGRPQWNRKKDSTG